MLAFLQDFTSEAKDKGLMAVLVLIIACVMTHAPGSRAQSYPVKPVRVISPFPAGLGPDVALRVMGEGLGSLWGQPVIIDPRPGANGFIAIEAAKRATPDGYTLLQAGQAQLAINPKLFRKAGYDPERDFVPISTFFRAPFFIVLPASGPIQNLRDLIAAAKNHPGKITYSSPYVGSPGHLGTEILAHLTGTRMLHVPYKEAAQVYTAVATGEVNWSMGSISSLIPGLKGGRIRLAAIATAVRAATQPDVPTVAEAGGPPGYFVDVWGGMTAPAGTPRDVIHDVSAAMNRVLSRLDVREKFRGMGLDAAPGTPEEMLQAIRDDARRFGEIITRMDISAD